MRENTKYSLKDIADLVENFRIMRCISDEEILAECADAIRKGYIECFSCNGTGKSKWQGYWRWCYKEEKSTWVRVKNIDGVCPTCNGSGKEEITIERFRKLQEGVN